MQITPSWRHRDVREQYWSDEEIDKLFTQVVSKGLDITNSPELRAMTLMEAKTLVDYVV